MSVIRIILFHLFLLPGYLLPAQNQGIHFRTVSYAEALHMAKTGQKMIFLDCYTSWCGPCKYMAEKVFVTETAGKYFNPRYVNIQVDMEKGEGKELAKKFAVQAFPTFLLIDTNENVRARVEGAGSIDDFIARLEKAQDEKSSVAYWDDLYQKGKLGKKKQVEYIKILAEARQWEKAQQVTDRLLTQLSARQKASKDYWFIFNHQTLSPFQSPRFMYLIDHRADFEKTLGAKVVDEKLYRMYNRWVMSYISGVILGKHEYRQSQMDSVRKQLPLFGAERKHELEIKCEIAELRYHKQYRRMVEILQQHLACIPQADLWDVATSFSIFGKEKDPEFFKELVALGKRFEKMAEDKELKSYMHNYFAYYVRQLTN